MAILENPKHEAFANFLARGLKQQDAYSQSGYSPNPAAASRLAKQPAMKARVAELKKEIHQKIHALVTAPSEEAYESLQEMGLNMHWVAEAYKKVYSEAVAAGQYAPANAAVKHIQTLVEIENNGAPELDHGSKPKIEVSEVTSMLREVRKLVEAAGDKQELVDITPTTEGDIPMPPMIEMDGDES